MVQRHNFEWLCSSMRYPLLSPTQSKHQIHVCTMLFIKFLPSFLGGWARLGFRFQGWSIVQVQSFKERTRLGATVIGAFTVVTSSTVKIRLYGGEYVINRAMLFCVTRFFRGRKSCKICFPLQIYCGQRRFLFIRCTNKIINSMEDFRCCFILMYCLQIIFSLSHPALILKPHLDLLS